MLIALETTLAVNRKEPLSETISKIRQAFLDAGLRDPTIRFLFADSLDKRISVVDRAVKRHPRLERFLTTSPPPHGQRVLTNCETAEPLEDAILQEVLAGIPRSYPFSSVGLHFTEPAFGERVVGLGLPRIGNSIPGVMVTDNWWVTGRQRDMRAYTVVEADAKSETLPAQPDSVATAIQRCGKVMRSGLTSASVVAASVPAANVQAAKAIVAAYRAGLKEVVERAGMPHDLPVASEARAHKAEKVAGERKPALEKAFKPMGYRCRGGSGVFHLTRRTSENLVVELYLDVGTWSHEVSASLQVHGAGFKASLALPVTRQSLPPTQYPIGDANQWQAIVANLAALVRELDRSLVPEIEQAAGPSPAWYQPAL